MTDSPLVALTGSPNCGKTALFNALTGGRQKVANYPGVTVERKEGRFKTERGVSYRLLDLPGTYSLDPHSIDERIALEVLTGKRDDCPEAMICVADATNLERCLGLVLEIRTLGRPVILALNMMDLARKRGLDVDLEVLSKELLVPVIPTVAIRKEGTKELKEALDRACKDSKVSTAAIDYPVPTAAEVRARFKEADRILKKSLRHETTPARWSERIDRLVLHPVLGHIILVGILGLMFQAVFSWADPFMGMIEGGVESFGALVASIIPASPLQSLIVDGIIAGVGSVLVFLPQILILFLFILMLEDSGYMARAAFLMDKSMGKVGLHGRAFLPLLSAFACAIPGLMACRTIENPRDRLATLFITPLMTCSARLPVYALLIAAFVPSATVFGFLNLQGLVMLGLYVGAVLFALLIAFTLKKTKLKAATPPFLLELPTFKIPGWRNVLLGLYERAKIFLKRAGKYILLTSMALWFLASYPAPPENATGSAIEYSYAGKIGAAIEPVLKPIGFDWRIATGLIPGFAAREVMVGALATVFAVEDSGDEEAMQSSLSEKLQLAWGLPTAIALLVWYIFSPQCLATYAVMQRETNSWSWTAVNFFLLLGLAYFMAFIAYRITLAVT